MSKPSHGESASFTLAPMTLDHVKAVVEVHRRSFQTFFLTFLGPRFLTLLYTEILAEPRSVAIVALNASGQVLGFVAGVSEQSGFYGRIARRRWFSFAIASVGAVLKRPAIIPRLFRALGQSSRSKSSSAQACLLSLAVDPAIEGRGTGRALVCEFLSRMQSLGVMKVGLTTDEVANDRTNRFYQKLGFRCIRNFTTPEGRRMNEYAIERAQNASFDV